MLYLHQHDPFQGRLLMSGTNGLKTAVLRAAGAALAAVFTAAAVCACSACGKTEGSSAPASSVPTPTPAPTMVAALLSLGKGGCLEDTYVKLYIPEYLEYDSSPAYNCAYYKYVDDNGKSLVFAYLPDEKTKYEKEIGSLTRESYSSQVYKSSGAELKEFKFTEVAGHKALRTLTFIQNEGGAARALTYFIDVDGWLLTLVYTTTRDELPAQCERGILEMEIKSSGNGLG